MKLGERRVVYYIGDGRPPRGGCGLKRERNNGKATINLSPPSRGVWIETNIYI